MQFGYHKKKAKDEAPPKFTLPRSTSIRILRAFISNIIPHPLWLLLKVAYLSEGHHVSLTRRSVH